MSVGQQVRGPHRAGRFAFLANASCRGSQRRRKAKQQHTGYTLAFDASGRDPQGHERVEKKRLPFRQNSRARQAQHGADRACTYNKTVGICRSELRGEALDTPIRRGAVAHKIAPSQAQSSAHLREAHGRLHPAPAQRALRTHAAEARM